MFTQELLSPDLEEEEEEGEESPRGVLIVGGAGTGKTSIVERLIALSQFGVEDQEGVDQDSPSRTDPGRINGRI